MRKISLFIVILLASVQFAKSQTIYWSENFEGSTTGWSVDAGTWEIGIPTSGPNAAYGGAKCAATVLAGNYSEGVNSRLTSPVITIPASNLNPRLRFWHWYNFNAGDTGTVQIKVVGTPTWQNISVGYYHTGSNTWSCPSIDLSSYAGQTVQIAFFFHSQQVGSFGNVSTGWYIDDISIVTGPIVFNNPETWENGIGDWYVDKGSWQVGTPTSGPTSPNGGTKCAATVLAGNYDENVDSKLISSAFVVPDLIQVPNLRFWHWYNFNAGDTGTVQIKVVGYPIWHNISLQYTGTSGGIWSCPYIDLTNYAGQTVQIAFFFHSQQVGSFGNVSTGWYIDDISLEYFRYHDASITNIISPDTTVAIHDTIYPKAIVKNFGLLADTIPVHFSIYPVFSDSTTIFLQSNQSDTVTFAAWIPTIQSTYNALCKTQLASDELHTNDSLSKTVLTIVDYSGISEKKKDNSIKIFPNPANTQVTIAWENPYNEEFNFALFDMYGKLLKNFNGIKSNNEVVNISNLLSGVYFVRLTGNKVYSSKFLKIE